MIRHTLRLLLNGRRDDEIAWRKYHQRQCELWAIEKGRLEREIAAAQKARDDIAVKGIETAREAGTWKGRAELAEKERESALDALEDAKSEIETDNSLFDTIASALGIRDAQGGYEHDKLEGACLALKARADRAERDLDTERRTAIGIIGPLRERNGALVKLLSHADGMVDLFAERGPILPPCAQLYYHARAALDATQPKAHTDSGQPDRTPSPGPDGLAVAPELSGCPDLSAEYAQLRKDVTTLAEMLNMISWHREDHAKLEAIIQRGQPSTHDQPAKLEIEDRERREAAFDDVIKAGEKARGG